MPPKRVRPKNRLETRTLKVKIGNLPAFYVHIERQRYATYLGPVENVWIDTGSKSGTEMNMAMARISRILNIHWQIKRVSLERKSHILGTPAEDSGDASFGNDDKADGESSIHDAVEHRGNTENMPGVFHAASEFMLSELNDRLLAAGLEPMRMEDVIRDAVGSHKGAG